jgi:hypothetical protein
MNFLKIDFYIKNIAFAGKFFLICNHEEVRGQRGYVAIKAADLGSCGKDQSCAYIDSLPAALIS